MGLGAGAINQGGGAGVQKGRGWSRLVPRNTVGVKTDN